MKPLASYEVPSEPWSPTPELKRSKTGSEFAAVAWLNPTPRLLRFAPRMVSASHDELAKEIERSREILSWSDDWDDAGSPRFEEATWVKATEFLARYARLLWRRSIVLPVPRILPGPNGSIDLHWETDRRELLINIPPTSMLAGFYGTASGMSSIKGKVDLSAVDLGLFTWLTVTD